WWAPTAVTLPHGRTTWQGRKRSGTGSELLLVPLRFLPWHRTVGGRQGAGATTWPGPTQEKGATR
ncbi:hypothetical protein, partial [[Kitasatospora] papulosa]|uniref:hypothetical protein n=1 Tax=[Kitasatospora] papulosa TaxID=1464011 RepID=UPI0036AB439E